jgi:hypothetical protein
MEAVDIGCKAWRWGGVEGSGDEGKRDEALCRGWSSGTFDTREETPRRHMFS